MVELGKVIKGLECCSQSDNYSGKPCKECPYNHEWRDDQGIVHLCKITQLRKDALFLLQAQEPKPPRFTVAYDKIFYACDNCGKSLVVMANSEGLVLQNYLPKYCNECGQAVKWPEPPKEG